MPLKTWPKVLIVPPADAKLKELLDRSAAPRQTDQEVYLAYASEDKFSLESADLLYVYDHHRAQYLDFTSGGGGILPLGHRSTAVRAALGEQLNHYGAVGPPGRYVLRWPVEYAKALSESLPNTTSVPMKVFYTPDEDSALSVANRMAQQVTDRVYLATSVDTESWLEHAAFICRFVSNGRPLPPADVATAVEHAHRDGALVIADETRTGYGRTGRLWGQERWNVNADITVLGGAGGGGFPFGAVVAPESYFEIAAKNIRPNLMAGNPVICAAGMQVLGQIDSPLLLHVEESAVEFNAALRGLVSQFAPLQGTSGVGLMHCLYFETHVEAQAFHLRCRKAGLLVAPPSGKVVGLTPALVISELEIRRGVDMMAEVLMDWKDPVPR